LRSLYKSWNRHLDLTCASSSDEDVQTTFGMLEHDQYFLGVSTANCPKKNAFAVASRVLKKNQTITLLSLRDVFPDTSKDKQDKQDKQIIEFCSSLNFARSFNALTWIDLSGNMLKESGAKSFASALAVFTHRFTHIDLSNCQINGKGLNAIFEAFIKNIPASVYMEYLDISKNKCDDSACSLLNEWLVKVTESVKPEDGAKGLNTLRMASCHASFSCMKSLPSVKSLTDVDISKNKIDDSSCGIVCDLLKNVKTLRLVDKKLKKEIQNKLVHAFLDPEKAASGLSLELSCATQPTKGRERSKSDRAPPSFIQSTSVPQELFDPASTKMLQRLTLSYASMQCVHMDRLCRALAVAPMLSSLSLQDVSPDCFVAPGSPAVWGAALANLVKANRTFMSLTLHGVHEDVIRIFFSRIASNSGCLTHINIGKCNLGDSGAFFVADMLPSIKTLRVLEMDENNIHSEGIHAIACSLANAHNITQVCMEHDIAQEVYTLNSNPSTAFLATQCLSYANALAVELANNAKSAEPLSRNGAAAKRLSVIEGSTRGGWNSLLPREIRVISPISEPLPLADMPRTPDKQLTRKTTLRKV